MALNIDASVFRIGLVVLLVAFAKYTDVVEEYQNIELLQLAALPCAKYLRRYMFGAPGLLFKVRVCDFEMWGWASRLEARKITTIAPPPYRTSACHVWCGSGVRMVAVGVATNVLQDRHVNQTQ